MGLWKPWKGLAYFDQIVIVAAELSVDPQSAIRVLAIRVLANMFELQIPTHSDVWFYHLSPSSSTFRIAILLEVVIRYSCLLSVSGSVSCPRWDATHCQAFHVVVTRRRRRLRFAI